MGKNEERVVSAFEIWCWRRVLKINGQIESCQPIKRLKDKKKEEEDSMYRRYCTEVIILRYTCLLTYSMEQSPS